ncbi:hypothetical protein ACIA5D_26755 [Actinoplanes sp. NPDC051513]|uniref:hypothetical protein n=1 Tax=Actinoplanes sp. NPDC051513 TaxID=3363908 RepID=UPI00378A7DEA
MPRLQQTVIDEFVQWASAAGLVLSAGAGTEWRERITILLQGRAQYLDRPDPTRWRSGDVHDLFMTYVVPRQVDNWDLAAQGLDTIRAFLRFLDAADRLHPASVRVPTLLKEVDRLGARYPVAMSDMSRWRLAKRVFHAILADGIPLDAEPTALDAWAQRFNARDAEGRRAVLGELMDERPGYATGHLLIHDGQVAMLGRGAPAAKHLAWPDLGCDCGCEQQAQFPPVVLPEAADLAKMVATDGAGWLSRLQAVAAWVGEGKTVDDRGEPRKADVPALLAALDLPAGGRGTSGTPALTRIWRLAIEFDVLQLRRTRVVAGSGANLIASALAGSGEPGQVLDFWCDLADELLDPPAPAAVPKNGEHLRDWLRPWMPRFLGILYTATATGEPAVLDTMIDQLLDEYERRLPPGDPALFAGLAAAVVRNTLSDLADHGAVAVAGIDDEVNDQQAAAAAIGVAPWALHPQPGLTANLTDLGRYLVRQRLLAEGAHAPLAGHADDARPTGPLDAVLP